MFFMIEKVLNKIKINIVIMKLGVVLEQITLKIIRSRRIFNIISQNMVALVFKRWFVIDFMKHLPLLVHNMDV